ncbi:hypothetical protein SK3146_01113 [Paenibacillus konkukensis]|uniref:Uncharacterized protein n=1 Tax=Paenibacillus konkukensis TaxID=2020716 RepID=A0ABY4RJA6_9BACL|nr:MULTISPECIES: hypothetical protein [Paenibacillus]UQZ81956.1 hypothetical protein SK3146_01113 [Paenibacillus konkukensis]
MKIGSFLLGGLVGAAAVMYFNNKSKSMLFSAFSSNNQSLGQMTDKSKERRKDSVHEEKHKPASAAASHDSGSSHEKDGSHSGSTLSKVEEIISQDPELKSTVDEILAENQQKEVYHTQ